MVIVAGRITVEPEQRESYLAGCLDFAITADLIHPGRVNLYERWGSQAAVDTFHRSAPRNKQGAAMLSASLTEYDIADVRHLFGERTT
jgi:quinol monooxygenase YgiN